MNAPLPHRHDRPPFIAATWPPPAAAIGTDTRDTALDLLAAVDARCEPCYLARMAQLDAAQADRPGPVLVHDSLYGVQDPQPGVVHTRTVEADLTAPPGPLERLLADMLWCAAQLLIWQAEGLEMSPTLWADRAMAQLTTDLPADTGPATAQVAQMVLRIVDTGADPDATLRAAQDITAIGVLFDDGTSRATLLLELAEMAVRLSAAVAESTLP